jgi:hypothetical protein
LSRISEVGNKRKILTKLKGGQKVFSSGVRMYSSVLFANTPKNSSTALSLISVRGRGGETGDCRVRLIEQRNQDIEKYYAITMTFQQRDAQTETTEL